MLTQTPLPDQTPNRPTTLEVQIEVDPLADIVAGTGTVSGPNCVPGGLRAPLWRLITTSGFGHRIHPVLGTTRFHRGTDFGARTGTNVRAAADGTIVWANDLGPYGTLVVIAHAENIHTAYGHLDSTAVTIGQVVRAGQRIGQVGITGMSTGPHLHFEIRDHGTPVEPTHWLTLHAPKTTRTFDAFTSKLRRRSRTRK